MNFDVANIFVKTTNNIKVSVRPLFLPNQSLPSENHYAWAYNVRLVNEGEKTVQLLNRYWHITDTNGVVKEVRGPGVVGEQPVLKPGQAYEYTSGTVLSTPSGIMVGNYEMIYEDGENFNIDIPAFSLDSPDQISRPN